MASAASDVKILREWLVKQQHLPQKIDDILLQQFLHCCNNSIEQSKHLIDLFYTIRSQTPEVFSDRDPASPELKETFENLDFITLPKLTKNNHKVFIYHIKTPDPAKYHCINALKAFSIFIDVRMAIEAEIPEGEVPIFDMANFTMKHLAKVNLPVFKKYMVYTQVRESEAHPIKLKQIHLINAPSFLDKCMMMVRPLMKAEVGKMVHTHLPNSSTLFDHVPKDLLPNEYGGNSGNVADIKKWWLEKIMEHRDYINDASRWTVDESKRPSDNKNSGKKMLLMEGSFRSLAID